jgi:hypothetical protein
MGEAAKKRRAAEAKAARKAKKDAERATQPAANLPASVDPISSGIKPLNSSGSKYSKKSKVVPQEKMPRAPPSNSTRRSARSRSTSAAVSSGSGEQHTSASLSTGNISTRPHRLATAAAEALLQQVRLSEDTVFEEDPDGDSDGEADMELDEDEDGSTITIGDDNESSSDDIEFVEGGEIEVAPTTQQGLARVSAASRGAQKKVPKVQVVVEEEEPSDEDFGESVC